MTTTTFGASLKGVRLPCQREELVYERACDTATEAPCAMQHWWSGGAFEGYPLTRVSYYVDGDRTPIVIPLGLGHGMAPTWMDDNAPWSAGALFGRTGNGIHTARASSHGSGLWNSFQIPFRAHVNVTISLGCARGSPRQSFWFALRGRTRATIVLPGGLTLPPTARLVTMENHAFKLPAYRLHTVFNASAAIDGTVLLVTLAVSSPNRSYAFLEGCLRAGTRRRSSLDSEASTQQQQQQQHLRAHRGRHTRGGGDVDRAKSLSELTRRGDGGGDEWLLSSGTEDYFLGSFYFNRGQYFTPLAGLTSLCPQPGEGFKGHGPIGCIPARGGTATFSAYRVHAGYDPLGFSSSASSSDAFQITWKNGEPGHGGGRPLPVNVSSFAMVYVWPRVQS